MYNIYIYIIYIYIYIHTHTHTHIHIHIHFNNKSSLKREVPNIYEIRVRVIRVSNRFVITRYVSSAQSGNFTCREARVINYKITKYEN